MGCDIHWHIETKDKDTEVEWEYNHVLSTETDPHRDYLLFSLLAGVRGVEEPLYPPRGLPGGVDPWGESEKSLRDEEYHTFSWLTLSELMEVAEAYDDIADMDDYPKVYYGDVWGILGAIKLHDVRVVFWFDS